MRSSKKKNIVSYRNYVKSLKDENERLIDELNQLKRCVVKSKCEIFVLLRDKIEDLHETLSKFT